MKKANPRLQAIRAKKKKKTAKKAQSPTSKSMFVQIDTTSGCGESLWKKLDREWFEANPQRSYRLRPLIPGEFGGASPLEINHVLVRQLQPGFRDRLAAHHTVGSVPLPDHDLFYALWWEALDKNDRSPIYLYDLAIQAALAYDTTSSSAH